MTPIKTFSIFVLVLLSVFVFSPHTTFAACAATNSSGCSLYGNQDAAGKPGMGSGSHLLRDCPKGISGCCYTVGCYYRQIVSTDFSEILTFYFYEDHANVSLNWLDAGQQTIGSTGPNFDALVDSLYAYGFFDTTKPRPASYDSNTAKAVTILKKAFGLTTPKPGDFDLTTPTVWKKFLDAATASIFEAGDNVEKFAIIWLDRSVSLFSVSYEKFLSPVSNFTVGIPTQSFPTFMKQDGDGKVYLWDHVARKFVLTQFAFPAPIVTGGTGGVSVKTPLSTLASTLSTIGSNLTTNFSTTRNVSSGTSNTVVVPSILQFLYNTGFSSYNPVSTANTFGPTSTDATKSLQGALGLNPSGTFDNTTATAATNLVNQINVAVNAPSLPVNVTGFSVYFPKNKSMSLFNSSTGVFGYSLTPFNPPAPINCGGVKQPPCVYPMTYKCCDASGDNCISAGSFGGGSQTCGGAGNSHCAGNEDGYTKCRDVF